MRALAATFADVVLLRNDIHSCRGWIGLEGGVHNSVLIVQRLLDSRLQQAVNTVGDLINVKMLRLEHLAAVDLPALFDEFELDGASRAQLAAYPPALRDWLAGSFAWEERRTDRPSRLT